MKYINTSNANTNACKKLTKSSIAITTNGAKKGTLKIALAAATINISSTTHANIFQNNLRVSDNTFVNSPINSKSHINKPNNISSIFTKNHNIALKILFGLSPAIPNPFNGIYLSKK